MTAVNMKAQQDFLIKASYRALRPNLRFFTEEQKKFGWGAAPTIRLMGRSI
jgi:hypothetical protein